MPGSEFSPTPLARPNAVAARRPGWPVFLAGLVVVLAGLAAYSNSFHGKFFLDDQPTIKENPTIQQDWSTALHPPGDGQTVTNRPLVNLSLAANYKFAQWASGDGFALPGYHALNLAVHLLAGLALLGLIRRTLELPKMRGRFAEAARPVAFIAALLWTVHPLQTDSVTYVVQRAESMMGLFFLVMMYCYVRGITARRWLWWPLAILAALASGLCKEVAVTAPVVVLLFDWVFLVEEPRGRLRERWLLYAGLTAVALFVAWRAYQAGTRGLTAGFGTGASWSAYALSQFPAIVNYLKLTAWPFPLVLDHGKAIVDRVSEALPAMLAIMALGVATVRALARRWVAGFLGAWFFVILAPSSSVVPIVTETAAEHRMYLSLAALAALVAAGLWQCLGRRAIPAALLLAGALAMLTYERNADYQSTLSQWQENVAEQPTNPRVWESYGLSLLAAGRLPEAAQMFRRGLQLQPDYPDCDYNLAGVLAVLGQYAEAVPHFRRAAQGMNGVDARAKAFFDLGNALAALQEWQPASEAFAQATQLKPDYVSAYYNLGSILRLHGDLGRAMAAFQTALHYAPVYPEAEFYLAETAVSAGQVEYALQHFAKAIEENPRGAEAYFQLGNALAGLGRFSEAAGQYAKAEALQPGRVEAHFNRGVCLAKLGSMVEAVAEFNEALRLDPALVQARSLIELISAPNHGPIRPSSNAPMEVQPKALP